jgi:murein L,D-transpeptidase YcbB/YkuD
VKRLRTLRAGLVPARSFTKLGGVAAALAAVAAPLCVSGAAAATTTAPAVAVQRSGESVQDFYRARAGQPLWLAAGSGPAAQQLLDLLSSARVDGLNPDQYRVDRLAKALRSARGGSARAVNQAETMLSNAFVAYARDLRRAPDIGIVYVDRALAPTAPSARALLQSAASAPSLSGFMQRMGWMHPTYAQLRHALASGAFSSEGQRRMLALNLERARALPSGSGRYVLVNTAAQRLYMYDNGEVVDSMRVVVGKPKNPTPMMSALIRFASLNPYWNVPPDLAAERIAPNVLKGGTSYLRSAGYQVLSDWGDNPSVVDPKSIDWKAVAEGTTEVRIRQLPGPGNAMGRMKFMFPNREGIYLHDTPERELLSEASRLFSGGCVRLEDAPRLGRWLYGQPLKPQGAQAEQRVPLAQPVPVYLVYLTAVPSGSQITYFDDIYGRDAARLAQLGGSGSPASR